MSELRILYSTFPDQKSAEAVASELIEVGLAACVNLIPVLSSTYKWKGKTERGNEIILLAKTTKKKIAKLRKKVESLHPYDCPCLITIKPSEVNKAYIAWVKGA